MSNSTKIVVLVAAILAGCGGQILDGKHEPITMTVVAINDDNSAWGCIGKNKRTVIRSDDGRTDEMCGIWGNVGDKISGCWVTGAKESLLNGFRRVCNG